CTSSPYTLPPSPLRSNGPSAISTGLRLFTVRMSCKYSRLANFRMCSPTQSEIAPLKLSQQELSYNSSEQYSNGNDWERIESNNRPTHHPLPESGIAIVTKLNDESTAPSQSLN